jgi:signal transduction histidine kinase
MAYSITSALLLGVYVATVSVAQSVLRGRFPDLAATALVAVAAVPALTAVQRLVERLLFGDRRDPDLVVRRLSERLASTPEALLPQVVEQVAHSLRLPYVAVELVDGSTPASSGRPLSTVQRVPLRHRGTTIGWLVAAQRAVDEPLGARELKLLHQIASQAGLAVHSSLLSAELRQASHRVHVARGEERARLQRDLHDELGPALGAISMRAEAARNLLRSGQVERVDQVLGTIERGAESAVAEVRRILAELGPQALEDHGLEAALRHAAAAAPANLAVLVDIAVDRRLPTRVELAVYRIATEALRNVVRHADATAVSISVRVLDDRVELVVLDDGTGLAPGWQPGVGTSSMRARATEVGGTLELTCRAGRGTALRARLPVVRR